MIIQSVLRARLTPKLSEKHQHEQHLPFSAQMYSTRMGIYPNTIRKVRTTKTNSEESGRQEYHAAARNSYCTIGRPYCTIHTPHTPKAVDDLVTTDRVKNAGGESVRREKVSVFEVGGWTDTQRRQRTK